MRKHWPILLVVFLITVLLAACGGKASTPAPKIESSAPTPNILASPIPTYTPPVTTPVYTPTATPVPTAPPTPRPTALPPLTPTAAPIVALSPTPTQVEYRNKAWKYSVWLPPDWTGGEEGNKAVFKPAGGLANVSISSSSYNTAGPLEQLVKEWENAGGKTLPSFQVITKTKVTLPGGLAAYSILSTFGGNDVPFKMMGILTVLEDRDLGKLAGYRLHVIMGMSPEVKWGEYGNQIEQILYSFAPEGENPTLSIASPPLTPKVDKRNWLVPDDYKTLAEAVQIAKDGEVIRIATGTYGIGSVRILRPLTIVGDGIDATVLGGSLVVQSPGVTVRHLNVAELMVEEGGELAASNIRVKVLKAVRVSNSPKQGSVKIVDSELSSPTFEMHNFTVENSLIASPLQGVQGQARFLVLGGGGTITRNTIVGPLIIGVGISPYTIASNVFTERASLFITGDKATVSNNDFLGGRDQARSTQDGTWRGNYWVGWDATKPVPILGNRAVDRSPSPKPVSGLGANKP